MTLLALFLGLIIERFVTHLLHWREPRWLDGYFDWGFQHFELPARPDGKPATLLTLAFCLLPVLPVAILAALFADVLLSLPYLLLAVFVLIFSLGPRDLKEEVDDYCAAVDRGDTEEAQRAAKAILEDDAVSRPGPAREQLEEAILVQSNNRLFGVIFWFMVLGPAGAWLFRVSDLLRRRAVFESERLCPIDGQGRTYLAATRQLHAVLSWLPARITALLFPLAGSFDEAVAGWREFYASASGEFLLMNDHVLVCVGKGALRSLLAGTPEGNPETWTARATIRLVMRTLVVWLVLLSLLTLLGLMA
jgi:AmpE protein